MISKIDSHAAVCTQVGDISPGARAQAPGDKSKRQHVDKHSRSQFIVVQVLSFPARSVEGSFFGLQTMEVRERGRKKGGCVWAGVCVYSAYSWLHYGISFIV